MEISLVKQWIDIHSEEGQRFAGFPDSCYALYDPADHPVFDPYDWGQKKGGANCLAYVLQAPGEVLNPGFIVRPADPGKDRLRDVYNRASADSPSVTMTEFRSCVYEGLEQDGLIRVGGSSLYRPGHYLIALCFVDIPLRHHKDFHFLVLNSNGRWSEVNGAGGFVSWTDQHDEPICNPATACFNSYTQFDSLYHVPRGGAAALRQARL